MQSPVWRQSSINDGFVVSNSLVRGLKDFTNTLDAVPEGSGFIHIRWDTSACLLQHGNIQNGRVLAMVCLEKYGLRGILI